MSRPRNRSLNALWTQLAGAPANVASLKWDPATGAFEATFRETVDVNVSAADEAEAAAAEDPRFLLERLGAANWPGKAD